MATRTPAAPESGAAANAAAEGDVNLTASRRAWMDANVGAATRALLEADAMRFLHQSLSTPCGGPSD